MHESGDGVGEAYLVSQPQSAKPISPIAYRVKQVAVMLNLPLSTVHDMVRRRTIESVRFGEGRKKQILIPAKAIEEFIERNTVPVRGPRRDEPRGHPHPP